MNETLRRRGKAADLALLGFAAVLSVVYIGLAINIPVSIISTAAHDDAFFMKAGKSIAALHWLGDYSQMTLIKGETYSLFLALNHLIGLPISLTTALFVVAADVFFAWTLYRLHGRGWLFCIVLPFLLFNPALLPTRIIRDAIYAPETLILLASAIRWLFLTRTLRGRIGWGIATGASLAAFWYTREEGIWIAPALGLLIAIQLLRDWRRWSGLVAAAAAAGILLAAAAGLNYAAYGSFVLVDFTAKPFASTLSLLQSVSVGEPVAKVPVPGKVRQRLYAESPAFAELQPYLENLGRWWAAPGCDAYPKTCGDYAGGWFMWAFRDAVAWAGHYKTAAEANAYYRRLSSEVQAACDAGRLTCGASAVPFLPALTADDLADLPIKFIQVNGLLFTPGAYVPWTSVGPPDALAADEDFLGHPLRYPTEAGSTREILGWYLDPEGGWIELGCAGQTAPIAIERLPSPDLADALRKPEAGNNRFRITIPPALKDCALQTTHAAAADGRIDVADLGTGAFELGGPSGHLQIDLVEARGGLGDWQFIKDSTVVYRHAFSIAILLVMAASATAAVLCLAFDRRRFAREADSLLLSVIFAIAVATRLAIIVLVDLSSFPAINEQYGSALFPLFTTALCLPLVLLGRRRPAASSGAGAEAA